MSPLILLQGEAHPVLKEGRGKENPDRPHSSSNSKIVLILLKDVITVHVGFPTVHVSGTGL